MNQPLVSVIVPTFNCGRFLEDAVESVLNQTYRRFEIILVDDGSTDDTASKLKKYSDQVQVVTQENQGSSKARNVGLGLSRGDYVAFLDADDRWRPEKLEWQLACFRELGYYLSVLDRENARKQAHASLAYEPFRLKPTWILLMSFTPLFVLDFLARAKRLLRTLSKRNWTG